MISCFVRTVVKVGQQMNDEQDYAVCLTEWGEQIRLRNPRFAMSIDEVMTYQSLDGDPLKQILYVIEKCLVVEEDMDVILKLNADQLQSIATQWMETFVVDE